MEFPITLFSGPDYRIADEQDTIRQREPVPVVRYAVRASGLRHRIGVPGALWI